MLSISSNDPRMSRDLANRSVVTRIRKRVGHDFKLNPEKMVAGNPAHYLGCVVAIIRAWAVQGCPRSTGADHDFKVWASSMDWIAQNIAACRRCSMGTGKLRHWRQARGRGR